MTDAPSGSCVVCRLRDPRYPQVCDSCRSRLASWLLEVPRLVVQVLELGPVERDVPGLGVLYPVGHVLEGERVRHFDPVANVFTAGPLSGAPSGPHIRNTPSSRPPIQLDAVDLTLPPRGTVSDVHHDQVGHLPVAAVLGVWCDAWREHRSRGERRPALTVPALCRWLGDRLDDACDSFPAMDDFAAELAGVRNALYGVLGLFDIPDYKRGVPCRNPKCDALNLLQRSGSKYIECGSCPQLLTEAEYHEWTQTVSGHFRSMRRKAG